METTIVKIMNGYLAVTPAEDGNLIWYSPDMVGINERLGKVYPENHAPVTRQQEKATYIDEEIDL